MSIEATLMAYVHEYDAKARALYPSYAARPVPSVTFFTKGRVNGLACNKDWEIKLNVYIAAQCPDEFRNTVSHEIAHMVDFAMRGRSAHDRIWKVIHRSLGGNGARCSAYTGNHIRIRAKNEYLYRNSAGAETWCGPKHHAALHRGDIAAIRNKLSGHRFIASDWTGESRILR